MKKKGKEKKFQPKVDNNVFEYVVRTVRIRFRNCSFNSNIVSASYC